MLFSSLRRCIGGFLLLLFTLGITPVSLLHDVLAHHTDVCYHQFNAKGKLITKADINCHCISFVAEANFINAHQPVIIASYPPLLAPHFTFLMLPFYSQHHFYSELRGPPSLI